MQRARGRVWAHGGALTGIGAAGPVAKLVALVRDRALQVNASGGSASQAVSGRCDGVPQMCSEG